MAGSRECLTVDYGKLHVEVKADGTVYAVNTEGAYCITFTRDEFRAFLSIILMAGLDRWHNPPFAG